jgi:hypothetical protein
MLNVSGGATTGDVDWSSLVARVVGAIDVGESCCGGDGDLVPGTDLGERKLATLASREVLADLERVVS